MYNAILINGIFIQAPECMMCLLMRKENIWKEEQMMRLWCETAQKYIKQHPETPGNNAEKTSSFRETRSSSDGSHRNKARRVQTVGRLTSTWSNVFCSPLPCLCRWKGWLNGLCTGWGIRLLSGLSFCQNAHGFSGYLVGVSVAGFPPQSQTVWLSVLLSAAVLNYRIYLKELICKQNVQYGRRKTLFPTNRRSKCLSHSFVFFTLHR